MLPGPGSCGHLLVHALKVAVRLFLAMAQVLHKRLVRLPELFQAPEAAAISWCMH